MGRQERIKVDKILEEWENHCQLMQGETKEKWLDYINTIKKYVNK